MLWVAKCTELFCVTRVMSSIMVLSFEVTNFMGDTMKK